MKLKTGAITAALLVTGLALTDAAISQPGPGRGSFMLPGIDADGDGLITRSEADAAVDASFQRLDSDNDGAISREEMQAQFEQRRAERRDRMQERASERLDAVDTDGDGALSLAELQAVRPELTQERFAQMDRNGDGLITADERPMRGFRGGRRSLGPRPQ